MIRSATAVSPLSISRLPSLFPLEWGTDSLPWIGFALLAVLGACAWPLWAMIGRFRRLESRLAKLEVLERIESVLARVLDDRDDLDLRRLEHVLVELRDDVRRQNERLISTLESLRQRSDARASAAIAPEAPGSGLAERVFGRLLAQGFDHIDLLTPAEELEALARGEGEIQVEARRDGAPHKGRVRVRDGMIVDVHLRSSYQVFP